MSDPVPVETRTVVSDEEGSKINQYQIIKKLGEGAFGIVYLVLNTENNKHYALKEMSKQKMKRKSFGFANRPRGNSAPGVGPPRLAPPGMRPPPSPRSPDDFAASDSPLDTLKREVAIMKKLNHPHIVKLAEVLDDDNADNLYIAMEYVSGGPIMSIDVREMHKLDDKLTRKYFRELILGVEYLHAQDICHRDLKPDNILCDENKTLKIVDFGVSLLTPGNDMVKKSAGSPAFMAPETIKENKSEDFTFSAKKADIWSMGVCLYCFCFGTVPFYGENPYLTYEKIRNDPVQCPPDTDPQLEDLIIKILEKEPAQRIGFPELRKHPWVTENGTIELIPEEENTRKLAPITQSDIMNSITPVKRLSGVVMTMRAINKFNAARKKAAAQNEAQNEPAEILIKVPNQPSISVQLDPS